MKKIVSVLLLISMPFLAGAQNDAVRASADIGAKAFVVQFWSEWSRPNDVALPYVRSTIDDQINFYGKSLSRDQYMKTQAAFVNRWPERQYTDQLGSERVACKPQIATCRVDGVITWRNSSPARSSTSTGSASFDFLLRYETIDGQTLYLLTSESGGVISRRESRITRIHGCAVFGASASECLSFPEWTKGFWTPPAGIVAAHVLLVGGGGGGGFTQSQGFGGAGGGSGKVITAHVLLNGQPVAVQVGRGGEGSGQFERGGMPGGASLFGALTALGGNGGSSWSENVEGTGGNSGGGGTGGGNYAAGYHAGTGGAGGTAGTDGGAGHSGSDPTNPVAGSPGSHGSPFPPFDFALTKVTPGAGGAGGQTSGTSPSGCGGGGGGGGGGVLLDGAGGNAKNGAFGIDTYPCGTDQGQPGGNGKGYGAGGGGTGNGVFDGKIANGSDGASGVVYVEW